MLVLVSSLVTVTATPGIAAPGGIGHVADDGSALYLGDRGDGCHEQQQQG